MIICICTALFTIMCCNAYMKVVPLDYNEAENFLSPSDVIMSQFNTLHKYHCVTVAYSIEFSNMLYRFIAQRQQSIQYSLGVQQAVPCMFVLVHSMMCIQQYHLRFHFSECIPIIKRSNHDCYYLCMSVNNILLFCMIKIY